MCWACSSTERCPGVVPLSFFTARVNSELKRVQRACSGTKYLCRLSVVPASACIDDIRRDRDQKLGIKAAFVEEVGEVVCRPNAAAAGRRDDGGDHNGRVDHCSSGSPREIVCLPRH
eukprot:scaffold139460_cov31-Prasinocladus_malaysianus.AAC.1